MTDKIELPQPPAATGEEHESAQKLYSCTYSSVDGVGSNGPWNRTVVHINGKSDKDFEVVQDVDKNTGDRDYNLKLDGKGYFDLQQPKGTSKPGVDTVFSTDVPMGQRFPQFKEGTEQFSDVVNLVRYGINYSDCEPKAPMTVNAGEGYEQVVKRVNPELSADEAHKDAQRIKKAMGGKDILKVGDPLKE